MTFILLLFLGGNCKAQQSTIDDTLQQSIVIEAVYENGMEPGKCYFSGRFNEVIDSLKKEGPFVIEIVPPIYDEIEIEYFGTKKQKQYPKNKLFQVQIRAAHCKFVMKLTELADLEKYRRSVFNPIARRYNPEAKIQEGFVYCMIEEPGQYMTLSNEKLKLLNNKILTFEIIQPSKFIKQYVKEKPHHLNENQYFFEGGYWTKPGELIAGSGCGVSITRRIKEKLIKLGYALEADNIFDEETKQAVIDFQQKKGIKVGQLDFETLKELGVAY